MCSPRAQVPAAFSELPQRVWFPALDATCVERLRIHDIRHTAAGLAVDAGANVKGVQAILGHADAAMTLNVYADLFVGHLDEVAERMDEAISLAAEASVRPGLSEVAPLRAASGEQLCL